jgi:hypothetical protein
MGLKIFNKLYTNIYFMYKYNINSEFILRYIVFNSTDPLLRFFTYPIVLEWRTNVH